MKESRPVTFRARSGVALDGQAAQGAAVDGDVTELLRDEVARGGGEQQDEQEADRDQHEGLAEEERRALPGSVLLPSWAVASIMARILSAAPVRCL
jgi:hypothetical protein